MPYPSSPFLGGSVPSGGNAMGGANLLSFSSSSFGGLYPGFDFKTCSSSCIVQLAISLSFANSFSNSAFLFLGLPSLGPLLIYPLPALTQGRLLSP